MFRRSALVLTAFVLSCGSSGDDGGGPDASIRDGATNPAGCDVLGGVCMACARTLESDSAACAVDPNACDAVEPLPAAIQCFMTNFTNEGQCQKTALNKAAVCHQDCCDVEQANVEICTGDCFVERAACQNRKLREYDTCYMACNDTVSCAICDARFQGASDQCGADAQACAQVCVMTHRKS